jgi:cell division protein FtsB
MLFLAAASAAAGGGTSASSPFDITQVLQFGLLGLIFLAMLFRKFVVPEWTLKQAEEQAKAEKAELTARLTETREQLEKLQTVFQDQMIPSLTRATEINARYTDELQRARYLRDNRDKGSRADADSPPPRD